MKREEARERLNAALISAFAHVRCDSSARIVGIDAALDAFEAAVRSECAVIAETHHPDEGPCCVENPDGHRGRVNECVAIAAAIRKGGE